jgi:hypothetical protein
VRLGSRTKSEMIKKFTLSGKLRPNSSDIPLIAQIFEDLEDIENEVEEIIKSTKSRITWKDVSEHLEKKEGKKFFNKFSNVTHKDLPSCVWELIMLLKKLVMEMKILKMKIFKIVMLKKLMKKIVVMKKLKNLRMNKQKPIFERWLRA